MREVERGRFLKWGIIGLHLLALFSLLWVSLQDSIFGRGGGPVIVLAALTLGFSLGKCLTHPPNPEGVPSPAVAEAQWALQACNDNLERVTQLLERMKERK